MIITQVDPTKNYEIILKLKKFSDLLNPALLLSLFSYQKSNKIILNLN